MWCWLGCRGLNAGTSRQRSTRCAIKFAVRLHKQHKKQSGGCCTGLCCKQWAFLTLTSDMFSIKMLKCQNKHQKFARIRLKVGDRGGALFWREIVYPPPSETAHSEDNKIFYLCSSSLVVVPFWLVCNIKLFIFYCILMFLFMSFLNFFFSFLLGELACCLPS
jgi:hypothetical protein